MIVSVSALRATKPEMGSLERVGHAAGRDPEGFHHERPEHERQDEGGDQPFEGVGDLRGTILLLDDGFLPVDPVDSIISHSLLSCPQMIACLFSGGGDELLRSLPRQELRPARKMKGPLCRRGPRRSTVEKFWPKVLDA
jgi:hypothetical protein